MRFFSLWLSFFVAVHGISRVISTGGRNSYWIIKWVSNSGSIIGSRTVSKWLISIEFGTCLSVCVCALSPAIQTTWLTSNVQNYLGRHYLSVVIVTTEKFINHFDCFITISLRITEFSYFCALKRNNKSVLNHLTNSFPLLFTHNRLHFDFDLQSVTGSRFHVWTINICLALIAALCDDKWQQRRQWD